MGQQSFAVLDKPKSVDEHRYKFFADVTEIIRKLKDKLLNAGYFKSLDDTSERGQKEQNKKATETAYSYLIQFILYKTLVDNGFPSFEKDFSKKASAVHKNLQRGSYSQVLAILEGISESISENIYKPFYQEQSIIIREVKELLHSGEDNLLSAAPFLDIFVLIKRYDFGNVKNDIFGAIYENYLKELYEKQLGQYFTDPDVVDFMLAEIGYQATEINHRKHESISIIDPSCGSGTFLYSAVRELIKARGDESETGSQSVEEDVRANVFGLDIAEFPLYLAEMSILMRLLPLILTEKYNNPIDKKLRLYVTEDSLAEFIRDVGFGSQGSLDLRWAYHGFMRDEADLSEMKDSLVARFDESASERIPRRRFDYVIGNPPYISYNQASKSVGVKLFRMMKEGSVKLSDIYGWNLHSAPDRRKKYPPKPNLYAFFISLGFALLKDNGRFCYIIPQTMLTETDYDVVRYHLSHDYTIDSLITFGAKLFVGRSTDQQKEIHTSSLILVCTKKPPAPNHTVECVSVFDQDGNVRDVLASLLEHRQVNARRVPQRTLRENVSNWKFITWEPALAKLYQRYRKQSESIKVYSEHRLSQNRFGARFYFDVGFILDERKEFRKRGKNMWGVVRLQEFLNFSNFRPKKFYPCNEEDIKLPKNSQGYEALYHRHKLLWEKSRRFKFFYTDEDVVPSMSHCQIISSDNREEIFFLFAVLNSSITREIFEAMFSVGNEKVGMFVVVSRLKAFVRTPLVDTPERIESKKRVISLVEKALDMEKEVLGQHVDIDTLVHRVGNLRVKGNQLLVSHRGRDMSFPIRRNSVGLVKAALAARFDTRGEMFGSEQSTSVRELKSLPAFDPAAQSAVLGQAEERILDMYGVTDRERTDLLSRRRSAFRRPC